MPEWMTTNTVYQRNVEKLLWNGREVIKELLLQELNLAY